MEFSTWNKYNQIDYILTTQRFKSSVNKTNTIAYPDATINNEHDQVICNIKTKMYIKKRIESTNIRYDLD